MRRFLVPAAVAALLAAAAAGLLGAAAPRAAAQAGKSVGIVIGSAARCVSWHAGMTGEDVLRAAARFTTGSGPYAGFVITINGLGRNPPDDTHYWSYWHEAPGASRWTYSDLGFSSYQPAAGSLEGWSYDNGRQRAAPPAPATYQQVCGGAAAASPAPSRTAPSPTAPSRTASRSAAPTGSASPHTTTVAPPHRSATPTRSPSRSPTPALTKRRPSATATAHLRATTSRTPASANTASRPAATPSDSSPSRPAVAFSAVTSAAPSSRSPQTSATSTTATPQTLSSLPAPHAGDTAPPSRGSPLPLVVTAIVIAVFAGAAFAVRRLGRPPS